MRQTLFYIPNQIGGVPFLMPAGVPYGFGLFLAVVLLCGGIILVNKFRHRGMDGDFWSSAGILTLAAAGIIFVIPLLTDEVGLPIRGYGMMLLVAVVAGVALGMWRARQVGANPEIILSMMFVLFAAGLIGGRSLYVIDKWEHEFRPAEWTAATVRATAWRVVNMTTGGLVVFGALLGAAPAFVWYVRKYGLPLLAMCDIVVASLLIGQGIGRIGCLLNGCCYGSVCEESSLPKIAFPFGSPAHRRQIEEGRLDVYQHGLRLKDDGHGGTVIAEVQPGSVAADRGLLPGQRIAVIRVGPRQDLEGPPPSAPLPDRPRVVVQNPKLREAQEVLFDANGRQNHDMVELFVEGEPGLSQARWIVENRRLSGSLTVHPTQIYEAIYACLMALFAWLYFPFRRRDGEVFALMLTIFPIARFLMEWVRTDEPAKYGGFTISQMISLGLFLGSFAFWYFVLRQTKESRLTPADWAAYNRHWATTD